MGVSTDGKICYGVMFEDGYEFPWSESDDIDGWWREINGFKHTFEIYGADGNYLNGVRPSNEVVSAYYAEERAFDEANPLPVELVNYCSCDYPMYILAIKRTEIRASRGYPTKFEPTALTVTDYDRTELLEFCTKYSLEFSDGPGWFLSSLWC